MAADGRIQLAARMVARVVGEVLTVGKPRVNSLGWAKLR